MHGSSSNVRSLSSCVLVTLGSLCASHTAGPPRGNVDIVATQARFHTTYTSVDGWPRGHKASASHQDPSVLGLQLELLSWFVYAEAAA